MLNELAEQAKNGNRAAEEKLFKHLRVRFRFFLTQRIGEDRAEDVAQKACMTVFEKYRSQEFTVSFEVWAHGVLKHVLSNEFRMNRTRRKHEADSDVDTLPDPVPPRTGSVDWQIVADCLKKVTSANRRYARILELKTYGYSIAEISERLRITKNNTCVILNRAIALLLRCVETGVLS